MRKKTQLLIAILLALLCLLSAATLAYLTDHEAVTASGRAGTVQLDGPNLAFLQGGTNTSEPTVSGSHMTKWAPGDINTIQWQVTNLGNKSTDLRYTIRMYWNEGQGLTAADGETSGSPLYAEQPYLYLYPANLTDEEIRADMSGNAPNRYIAIGSADIQYKNAANATRYGYEFTITGDTLDGVGQAAETGDAVEAKYFKNQTDFDLADDLEAPISATSDRAAFKIALSPEAPAGFMNYKLMFDLLVEGKQHRNTDSGWTVVETQSAQ